jgi:hypothetical protein
MNSSLNGAWGEEDSLRFDCITQHMDFLSVMTANWPAYIEHLHSELTVLVNKP